MTVAADVRVALDAIYGGALPADLESEQLDFKQVGRSQTDTLGNLAEAAACFANARGGSLVVGVKDRTPGPDAFVRCELTVADVRRAIFERVEPPLTVDVEPLVHAGGECLVISVPQGATLHSYKGRSTERVGTSCEPMRPERIALVVDERKGADWSDGSTELPLSAVDPLAMASARQFLGAGGTAVQQRFARMTDPDLLRALGVVSPQGRLKRAGELLFVDSSERGEYMAYVHRRTPAGALTTNTQFRGSLVSALRELFELIAARVDTTSVNVTSLVQAQIADLPERAVREAIVNAVMHRDWRDGSRVMVEHTATQLSVTSPGPFLAGITPQNVLTSVSRTRNRTLSQAVRALGLAETAGTGVDRMFAAMAGLGHQPPSFDSGEANVRVTLVGGAPNEHLARLVATLPEGSSDDADTMLVLVWLLTKRTVTAAGVAAVLQKPEHEAQAVLSRLNASPLDLLEPTRESSRLRRPTYRLREGPVAALGPAVAYRRRTLDSIDRRITELTREAGVINARMVRLVLDTDPTTTSRILGDLVSRGLLLRTSVATRGPGVTYGPGPKFPGKPAKRHPRAGSSGMPDADNALSGLEEPSE
jgi:ATP-dependent DNA helicase RecG